MIIRLPLEGTKNTRNLGGYATPSGYVKFNEIFRSDSLKYLTKRDVEYLKELGIKEVIDLRHEVERLRDPSNLPDAIKKVEISLIDDLFEATSEIFYKSVKLDVLYSKILDQSQDNIKKILFHILNSNHPIMFHCTAGKDRTGLISMLLLGILEVSQADIVAQYQVSSTYLKERHDLYNIKDEDSKILIDSNPANMEKTIHYLLDKYHSFHEYFLLIGITNEMIETFKNKMIIAKERL